MPDTSKRVHYCKKCGKPMEYKEKSMLYIYDVCNRKFNRQSRIVGGLKMKLMHGDCIELMNEIKDKSIDMILCDLPYGITKCEWDIPIDLDSLWKQYKRIIKDNGAIVLFSAQPFTTDLIESNRKMFRYEIIWKKTTPSGFLNAKKNANENS